MFNYKIKIKAFDGYVLNLSVIQIMNYISKNNIKVNGPIPLPTKKKIYTILRSPHVHKKSREQFKLFTHKIFVVVYNVKYNLLKKIYIPSCVKLEITKIC
ncbi:MAG: 30S ribosomal protein S10 [Candidatus Karelsulcia muelleri]